MEECLAHNQEVQGSKPCGDILSVWRNWIAHQSSKLGVAGSSPVMDIFAQIPEWSKGIDSSSIASCFVGSNPTLCIAYIAQLVRAYAL